MAKKSEDICLLSDICQEFTLNKEQERAFRIVANHAIQPSGEVLRMYLGTSALQALHLHALPLRTLRL